VYLYSNITVADGLNVVRRDVKVPQVLAESSDGSRPPDEPRRVCRRAVGVGERSVRVRSADSTSFCSIRRKSCRRSAAPSTSMSECGCRRAPRPESGDEGEFSVDRRKLDLIGCPRSRRTLVGTHRAVRAAPPSSIVAGRQCAARKRRLRRPPRRSCATWRRR
jgi:hypothetical protein